MWNYHPLITKDWEEYFNETTYLTFSKLLSFFPACLPEWIWWQRISHPLCIWFWLFLYHIEENEKHTAEAACAGFYCYATIYQVHAPHKMFEWSRWVLTKPYISVPSSKPHSTNYNQSDTGYVSSNIRFTFSISTLIGTFSS